jgi:hypothetical protein
MNAMSKTLAYWFIREGTKLIQCNKDEFDKAIREGKSVKYRMYADKKSEKIAEALEESRMAFLNNPATPTRFRAVITKPENVVQIEIIEADDPDFWVKESKNPKYQIMLNEK